MAVRRTHSPPLPGRLQLNYTRMCVSKRTWVLFGPQVSEMSGVNSLKMGVKFDISLNMGEKNPTRITSSNVQKCKG